VFADMVCFVDTTSIAGSVGVVNFVFYWLSFVVDYYFKFFLWWGVHMFGTFKTCFVGLKTDSTTEIITSEALCGDGEHVVTVITF
jgi:hypothetical protein